MKRTSAWKEALLPGSLLAVILLIGLPLLNASGYISDYYLNLFGKYLSLAVLAMGMALIWGFSGILSLGQAIFFGIGAYSFGMYLMLESSGKGVYGEAIPDFMVWNQVTQLPLYWKPFHSLPFALAAALLLPVVAATIIGFLTFRRRVGGTYFAILTQAMAFATWLMFNRNELNLGGTNGLTDFKSVLGYPLSEPSTQRGLYLCTALLLVVSFFICRWLVGSKMGLVLTAMRDQEQRLRFLGYPVASYKIFIFAVAAALGGLAGALYVPQVGIITPSQIGVLPSLEIVVWVATGGRNSLIGAIIGAVGINAARSVLTTRFPEWWPVILGGLFVAVVLFFPDGIVGIPSQCRRGIRRLRARLAGAPARRSEPATRPSERPASTVSRSDD
jgi:urea transport system permease protein